MGRQPCCDKVELQRGLWTIEEDHKLKRFILNNGIQCWRRVPKLAGLLRCGKSCRLRWINYLNPDLKRGPLSEAEENQIIQLHACLGRRWSKIASHFPGRTDNEIKNHWNTRIKKRLKQLGTDPVNHKPIEQNDKFEEETETIEKVSSPKGEDVTVDVKSSQNDFPDEGANSIKSENEVGVTSHETVNLVNRHEMLRGRLDKDLPMVRDINPCTSYSPSISIEDSLNPSNEQVNMGRQPRSDKVRLQRGPWTMEEDHKLKKFIVNNGIQCWQMVPKRAGLLRCGKSCRLRWINYLKPDLKRGPLSEVEENQIIQLHARLGSRWSKIASHFPGRTDNEIKNHWNTRIKKRLKQLGADPGTHKPIEQNDKFEEETEAIEQQVSSPKGEDTTVDVKSSRNDFPDEGASSIKSENEVGVTSHETVDLVNRHEMLRGRLDKDLSMVREIEPCTSCSPSISMEDSLNPSNGESTSTQEESVQQQWVDSLDSSLAWSYFNQLDEELLFSKGH